VAEGVLPKIRGEGKGDGLEGCGQGHDSQGDTLWPKDGHNNPCLGGKKAVLTWIH